MAAFLKHLIFARPTKTLLREKYGGLNVCKFLSNKKVSAAKTFQQPKTEESVAANLYSKNGKTTSYKVGQKIKGFLIKEIEAVPEFQLTAIKLVHEATGGQYLHIDRDDTNNAFSVMFRTTPRDSTGLPHILEHTTLCGSAKFPCRDPFFKMLNRSLATFMNAITAPDYTMYPFSTQNPKDFENLMSVYLDAVFRPQLKELDFQQEGWRLEHENPEDPKSPIIIKGVVYNEMKGVFADNQNIFEYALQSSLLPSHTYGVCSGGDPAEIPSLTHEDLKNFHKNYYSPFNTKYYTYGNFPLENHIKFLNDHYLEKFNVDVKNKISTIVPQEKKWVEPVRKHISCRVDPLAADKNKQSTIAISVLCGSITDIDECFLLKVLTQLLVCGPNSSFYKTLIEPNIGAGFSPATGFESQTRDTFFTVGLQGVSENDFEKIIQIYEDTIDDVIQKGFKQEHLEAVLHTIELNLKHQTSDFGLGLIFSVAPIWNHEGSVVDFIKVENQVEKFKQNIAQDPEYLQKAVKKYFKNNKHKLILTMSPSDDYNEKEKKKEEEILNKKLENLTEEDKVKIFENGLKLLQEQKKDDKSCLPTLKISDLKESIEKTEIKEKNVDGIKFYIIPQSTNGISYFRGLLTLDDLSDDLKSLLPLFALVSTKMGTKKYNHKEFDQLVNLKTGGLDVSVHLKTDPKNMDYIEDGLLISSFCLNKNLDSMFELWLEIFEGLELKNLELFETLVNGHAAGLVNGVTHVGHYYAMISAASLISPANFLKEKTSGLTYVNLMKKVAQSNLGEVLSKLVEIQNKVMTRSHLRCAANILGGSENAVLKSAANFIENAPGAVAKSDSLRRVSMPDISTKGLFHVLPIPVSYTSKAVIAVPYEHADFSALSVMARLMTMKHLHPLIREKGGAYGSGLNICSSGVLRFYSYRDPNPANSHSVYDNAVSWLSQGEFTQEDVDEAKLGVFQSIDAPVPPGSRGMRWFLHGISDDSVQKHRLKAMKVTKEDVIKVGEKYLGEQNTNPVGRVVIGPENQSITENTNQNWTVHKQE